MPAEIVALFDKPHLLLLVLGVGAYFGVVAEQLMSKMRRQRWRQESRTPWRWRGRGASITPDLRKSAPDQPPAKQPDAADQLRIVMGSDFTMQPLLNRSEARVFRELDRMVVERNPTWQVMAQVSLGEILRSEDADAYSCINSKRVDLLLMDAQCLPRHAVEY